MGYSSYHEVVPDSLLARVSAEADVWRAFRRMWGHGSGMYVWFEQLSPAEIEEACEGVPPAGVAALRELLRTSRSYPNGFIGKTHEEHRAILGAAFSRVGASADLARVIVDGESDLGMDTALRCTSSAACQRAVDALRRVDLREAVLAFPLGPRKPADLWRESLLQELARLTEALEAAAADGHQVIVGGFRDA